MNFLLRNVVGPSLLSLLSSEKEHCLQALSLERDLSLQSHLGGTNLNVCNRLHYTTKLFGEFILLCSFAPTLCTDMVSVLQCINLCLCCPDIVLPVLVFESHQELASYHRRRRERNFITLLCC